MTDRGSLQLVTPISDPSSRVGDEPCASNGWSSVTQNLEQQLRLARTIEGEIVPRLLMSVSLARRSLTARTPLDSQTADDDINELARLLLNHDFSVASAFAHILRERGATHRHISVDLLAPAAWRLRELWQRGECDDAALTTGLERLDAVIREFSADF